MAWDEVAEPSHISVRNIVNFMGVNKNKAAFI